MKPARFVRCLLILGFSAGLCASENGLLIPKEAVGRPYFDERGQPGIVYAGADGRILLESRGDGSIPPKIIRDCGPAKAVRSLRVKKDRWGRSWLVWEEASAESAGHIFIGRMEGSGLTGVKNISAGFEGRQHAPDLDISPGARPFAVWIQTRSHESRLILKGFSPEQTWIVRTSQEDALFTPRLLADGEGGIWVFWTEAAGGPDEIFFSRLEGGVLTEPRSLTPETGVPHFHPAPAGDVHGFPLLTWTSFDGEDYQIYLRSFDGSDWRPPVKLTNARGTANGQPAAALLQGSIPAVVWLRDLGGIRDILLSYRKTDGTWSAALSIAGEAPGLSNPDLTAEGDRLAVSWESAEGPRLAALSVADLPMRIRARDHPKVRSAPSGFRADDAFIAFGDSITYGILVPPWDIRELGYPPRLQILLKALYDNPQVINRGVPGDDTWSGVSRISDAVTHDLALYLLLKLGTNDVSGESYSMITTAFNLGEMAAKCRKHGVFPLIATIIPRKGNRWTDFTISRTLNLNNRIRRLSQDQKILLVDMFEIFFNYPEDQGGWESLIADDPDNLHPSLKGYQLMAESWFSHIRRIPFSPVSAAARRMMKDGAVDLTWSADPKIITETGLASYKILRKRQTESDFGEIGIVPFSQTSFRDESPDLGQELIYALKSVAVSGLEGPVSVPVFPVQGDPYPPLNITSRTVANRALLRTEYINIVGWEDNPANDGVFEVAFYKIYRKKKEDGEDLFSLVGELPSHRKEFLDRHFPSPEEAARYVYGISAVDKNGIEGVLGTASR